MIKYFKYIISAIYYFISNAYSQDGRWVYVGTSDNANYYYDSKTIVRKGNIGEIRIKFMYIDSEKWDYCDALVDIMPAAFQNKPTGKTSIKINHLFNQWDAADYSFDSIKGICNKDFFDSIFKDNQ